MKTRHPLVVASLLLGVAAFSACQGQDDASAQQQAAPPPSAVGVVEMKAQPIPVISDLPGRIAPTRIAEVRPRVGGIVLERVFEQGTDVKEGDPLFRIDPATFEVAVRSAEAAVARAEAVLVQAQQEAERTRSLVASRTTSQANLDTAIANQRAAEADVAAARAQLRNAQINLEYTTVRAPISGRIGRALVTEGALVSTSDTQELATIQQLDPVYADIQQPVAELLRLRQAMRTGAIQQDEPDVARVRLRFDDGTTYPQEGRLLFSEATVDPTSGQVTLRAEFPNPDDTLLPGLYVRVGIDQGVQPDALSVPNQAIQRDTAGQAQLYVVNAESKIEVRPVIAGRVLGDQTVITKGIAAGDKVVADGFQKIGPGAPVTVQPWAPVGEAPKALGGDTPNQGAVGAGTEQPGGTTPPTAAGEAQDAPAASGQGNGASAEDNQSVATSR